MLKFILKTFKLCYFRLINIVDNALLIAIRAIKVMEFCLRFFFLDFEPIREKFNIDLKLLFICLGFFYMFVEVVHAVLMNFN